MDHMVSVPAPAPARTLRARTSTATLTTGLASAAGLTAALGAVAVGEHSFGFHPAAMLGAWPLYGLLGATVAAASAFAARKASWLPLTALSVAALALLIPAAHWLTARSGLEAALWLTLAASAAAAICAARNARTRGTVWSGPMVRRPAPFGDGIRAFSAAFFLGLFTCSLGALVYAARRRRELGDTAAVAAQAAPVEIEQESGPVQSLDELLAELDGLVGLAPVKEQVHRLVDFIQLTQERERRGLPTEPITLHLAFKGNPGSGKTKLARIIARLYFTLGLLPAATVIEKQAGDLTAGYVRQTAKRVDEACDEALGGVLFLDEIDALIPSGQQDFAREAIKALLARAENDRAQLVVIIAGYGDAVDAFLACDPGLPSRFPTRIDFPDYSPDELVAITRRFCADESYRLDLSAADELATAFRARGASGGNARLARNLYEQAKLAQPQRLRALGTGLRALPTEALQTLTGEDIVAASVAVSL